jgi:ribonuclease VapC
MHEARAAWQRFGKGQHPAALNLGDCCAYAAAITSGEPLLYKGEYFQKTDVDQAPW